MIAIVLALTAGLGSYLLISPATPRTSPVGPSSVTRVWSQRIDERLAQSGLSGVDKKELSLFVTSLFAGGVVVGWMMFGGLIVPVVTGTMCASFPFAWMKQRRARRSALAAESWPRLIEETRLRCGSLGRPIPQALLEVGKRGPVELRPAFVAAEREWLISTDFSRTVSVLKEQLADPTADATCETLLVAHAVGGTDVDRRLKALAIDRQKDLQARKDARAKQAGVRFARRFVLVVPIGMAMAGMAIGNGRSAYSSDGGQIGVALGLFVLAGCWYWAGRLIQLPDEERVLRA